MKLHYLQHVPFENPGIILDWAEENGHTLSKTLLYENAPVPTEPDFDWLVIMGGPMNIYEHEKYPWLIEEKALIQKAIQQQKVVIGLCLGAQLIADGIGGKVTRNPQKEIGWFTVHLHPKVQNSSLFSFMPKEMMVFEWHGDTFSELPNEAICIAENEACKHQAFMYRNRVFGFQFHLENTEDILKGLVENCKDELVSGPFIQSSGEILSHPEYIQQDNAWMRQFLTELYNQYEKGGLGWNR